MKKILAFLKRNYFILAFVVIYLAADMALVYGNPIKDSPYFYRNDFELTQEKHPEEVWDKVFFGSSLVISAFIEEESESGYVNLGVDYGVVSDLRRMIEKDLVKVGEDLVVGLNMFTLYDDFDTNKTYMWHKKWYEPYPYFERDRFQPLLTEGFENVLSGKPFMTPEHEGQKKSVYYGQLSDAEMDEKLEKYREKYWGLELESFEQNLEDLEWLANYCEQNGIRMRVVWMPWRTKIELPDIARDVQAAANQVLEKHGIEVLDLRDELGDQYFHDVWHIEYSTGAPAFTRLIDEWL